MRLNYGGVSARAARILLGLVLPGATALHAWAQQATLVADAHVNSALPAVNSGAISNLNVSAGYTTLVQFDLGLLPAGVMAAQVSRAVLMLYCNRVNTPGAVSVQAVNSTWGEYSVTYATLPVLLGSAQAFSVNQAGTYIAIDVTSLVKGWVATPSSNNGLALTGSGADVQFDSKENDQTGHAPALTISLAAGGGTGVAGPAGAPGPPGPAGPPGLTGLQGPIGYTGAAGPVGFPGAVGPAGPPGLQGTAGPAGPTGLPGGAGPAGANGAAGAAGAPGLVYQGSYNSVTNYALGDVVLWQGASYSSLTAGNHGNTPGLVPGYWGVLTAQGPAGVAGPQGIAGATGPQGVPGFVGPPGTQGLQGVAGPEGPVGAQGLTGPAGNAGDRGPQGLQGIAGQAGAQGIPGTTGAQGLSGPAGPQGVQGPVGLHFQGPYSSITNYGLGDGVLYGGAGYVSIVASNHGNTPDLSPQQWSEFASGGAGPAGPAGPSGPTGGNGAPGLNGAPGPVGVQGPVGPQGPPVANYTGNYASTANYALNDAVSYGGSTYISLTAGNHGNTPDQSPQQWAVLVAQGAAGPAGLPGPAGPAGVAGAVGSIGPAGPQGPPVRFTGYWDVARAYLLGDVTGYAGSSYVALVANTGRQPDLSPVYWSVLAQAGVGTPGATGPAGPQGGMGYPGPAGAAGPVGPVGATGLTGTIGPAGAVGPAGPTGVQGPTGIAGVAYRGTYSSSINYGLNDAVTYLGSSYISKVPTNLGEAPDLSPAYWGVLAAQGAAGAVGARFRGSWGSGVPYVVSDAVAYNGSTYLAQTANQAQQPDLYPLTWAVMAQAGAIGTAGPSGPSGAAATVNVGTVTTGPAGSQASVVNTGTASAAVFSFTIPQGVAGSSGGGSGGSGSGVSLASVYHTVSNSFLYYSATNATASATDNTPTSPPVLTWVPNGCTATSLMVYSEQGNQVTVRLRSGPTPTTLTDTTLACFVTAAVPCTATGSTIVPPGSFIDLSVLGANGSPSPVWTALTCN